MGLIHADRREYTQGKVCFQKAVDLFLETGKCLPAAEALSNLGSIYHLQDELEDAFGLLQSRSRTLLGAGQPS